MDSAVTTDAVAPVQTPSDGAAATDVALNERIEKLERELRDAQQALRRAEVRSLINRALAGAGAVDADAVTLVVEASLDVVRADAQAVAKAVEDVRRSRPALFRPAATRSASMGARVERPAASPADAALEAARGGDRGALLRYLRLRRTA